MAYSSPSTQATGQIGTAAYANSLKAGLDYLANPPACRVYRSSSQSITNNTLTAVTFDSERYDTDTMHSTSVNTSRVTFTTAGIYVVTANLLWQADTDYTRRLADILLGGATILARKSDESPAHAVANDEGWQIHTQYKFAAGNYIELRVFQTNTSAGANNVVAAGNYSPELSATWVGLG